MVLIVYHVFVYKVYQTILVKIWLIDVSGVTSLWQGLILSNSYANNINKILFTNGTNIYLRQQPNNLSLNYFMMGRNGYSEFVINNLRYIGINNSNPIYTLRVAGNSYIGSNLTVVGTITNTTLTAKLNTWQLILLH